MQSDLGLRSLEQRRVDASVIMFYKIIHGVVAISLPVYFEQLSRQTWHSHPFAFCSKFTLLPMFIFSCTHIFPTSLFFFFLRVRNSYRMSARGAWIGTTSARGNVNSKRRQPRGVYIRIPRAEVIPIHAPRARIQ